MYQNRHGKRSVVTETVCDEDLWILQLFVGCPGSHNDLNVMLVFPLYFSVTHGEWPLCTYSFTANGTNRTLLYYLVDGIYRRFAFFVSPFQNATREVELTFNRLQEALRKDAERLYAVLTAGFDIVLHPAKYASVAEMVTVTKAVAIFHNIGNEQRRDGYVSRTRMAAGTQAAGAATVGGAGGGGHGAAAAAAGQAAGGGGTGGWAGGGGAGGSGAPAAAGGQAAGGGGSAGPGKGGGGVGSGPLGAAAAAGGEAARGGGSGAFVTAAGQASGGGGFAGLGQGGGGVGSGRLGEAAAAGGEAAGVVTCGSGLAGPLPAAVAAGGKVACGSALVAYHAAAAGGGQAAGGGGLVAAKPAAGVGGAGRDGLAAAADERCRGGGA